MFSSFMVIDKKSFGGGHITDLYLAILFPFQKSGVILRAQICVNGQVIMQGRQNGSGTLAKSHSWTMLHLLITLLVIKASC